MVLFFWGGDVGVVGANGAEIRRSACRFTETGEKVKGNSPRDGSWKKVAADKVL